MCVCVCVCVCVYFISRIFIYIHVFVSLAVCVMRINMCVCVCVCVRGSKAAADDDDDDDGGCLAGCELTYPFFFFLLVQKHNLNCVCVIIQSFSGFLFFPMIIWLFSMCVCMRYFLVIPGHYYFFFQCCNRAFFFFHHQWWWWWWWYIIFHVCLWAPSIQLLVNEWINGHWNGFKKIFRFKLSYITFIYSWKWLYIDFKTCTRVAEQKEIRILEF